MRKALAEFVGQFGFRSQEGVVDAWTWRAGFGFLVVLFIALTTVWGLVEPYAHRQLTPQSSLIDWKALATFLYLFFYSFAVLFIGVSLFNLSAKRLRARGLPTALAGLIPLAALFAGAAHWLQPRVAEHFSHWIVVGLDALLVGALVWTVLELGFREPRG